MKKLQLLKQKNFLKPNRKIFLKKDFKKSFLRGSVAEEMAVLYGNGTQSVNHNI